MKYLLCPAGNHSNRLFQLIHIVAYCEEYHQPLEILCFDDMAPLYQDGYYCVPHRKRFLSPIIRFLDKVQRRTKIGFLPIIDFYDDEVMEKHPLESLPKTCIIDGWSFRCYDLTKKYRSFFRQKYTLKEEYYKDNQLCLQASALNRNEYQKVGVHIRRGDYKEFQGGKYYYENDVFLKYMTQISDEISKIGKKTKFYLFSNEPIASVFTESFDTVISDNPWYIDQYLMTQMDYLIGPPSTFTGWASYINEVPLFFMETAEEELKLDKFHIDNG